MGSFDVLNDDDPRFVAHEKRNEVNEVAVKAPPTPAYLEKGDLVEVHGVQFKVDRINPDKNCKFPVEIDVTEYSPKPHDNKIWECYTRDGKGATWHKTPSLVLISRAVKDKKLKLEIDDGRVFTIDVKEIATDRANHYHTKNHSKNVFEDDFNETMKDDEKATDWLFNNMNWYECKTLKLVNNIRLQKLWEAEVIDHTIFEVPDEES